VLRAQMAAVDVDFMASAPLLGGGEGLREPAAVTVRLRENSVETSSPRSVLR
jgi:hypothetical protein